MTKTTEALHGRLVAVGVTMSASQLQNAIEAHLDPPPGAGPGTVGEHYLALEPLVGRGRSTDEAAMQLALDGYPTTGLNDVVLRLAGIDAWPPTPVPGDPEFSTFVESSAEHVVQDRRGTDSLMASVIDRLARGSIAAGPPWPEADNHEDLQHLGRVEATVEDLASWGLGDGELDATDLTGMLNGAIDEHTVADGLALADLAVGTEAPSDAYAHALDDLDPAGIALAVRTAAAMVPLFEALGVIAPKTARERWEAIAQITPTSVLYGRLFNAAGPDRLPTVGMALDRLAQAFDDPERVKRYRDADPATLTGRQTTAPVATPQDEPETEHDY